MARTRRRSESPSSDPPPESSPESSNESPEEEIGVRELLSQLRSTDPLSIVKELFRARKRGQEHRANCERAQEAAAELNKILQDLLLPKSTLYSLEDVYCDATGTNFAVVPIQGTSRLLPIHPDADVDELRTLKAWDYVKVHPTELVVQGVYREGDLWSRALGDIVSFQSYHDRDRGLVRTKQEGGRDAIVCLDESFQERELATGDQLVLMRQDARRAIDIISCESMRCKYEMPVEGITTRLEHLAGVDSILGKLIEDLLLRMIERDTCAKFDLEPLNGMLLYSYKAGMGKTSLVRAVVGWLRDLGQEQGFDVALFCVKPNALKSMWHGEDARLVREELCGSIRARLEQPRERPLFLFVVLDEVESLGRRSGGNDGFVSPSQNDAVQALLAEMDGMDQVRLGDESCPAQVLWIGLTNRPDMLDEALKRPGRFGDLVLEMPDYDLDAAIKIMRVYAGNETLPWYVDGSVSQRTPIEELEAQILRPAMAKVFNLGVLRCWTEARESREVRAGEILAGVHYKNAVNRAKRSAAVRQLRGLGVPAVGLDDLIDGLLAEACSVAGQMEADKQMLARQLRLKLPVVRVELVDPQELRVHEYLRVV